MIRQDRLLERSVKEVCSQYNLDVAQDQWSGFCSQVETHFNNQSSKSSTKLHAIINNYYHDGLKVEILMNSDHSKHEEAWLAVHDQILQYLYYLKYYPVDDVQLDTYSPDVRAFEQLKKTLPQFFFGCRLSTFIYTAVESAGKEWFRARAALKRGGTGITTATERRSASYKPRSAWKHQYLSASPSQNGLPLEEQIVDTSEHTETMIEDRVLVNKISQLVQGLQADSEYELISQLWYTLLFDDYKMSALARQYDIPRNRLVKIKQRLINYVKPVVSEWIR